MKLATSNSLTAPAGRGELEFHYTALSFQKPEKNRFKYRLQGVDPDWVDAGNRRVAYYNNIRPGSYTFKVIGCNGDGVWNEMGASVALVLQPHFWQTRWFLALNVVVAIGFIAGTARYITWKRVQQRLVRLEQQHAIERERTRIAQDMHDDLGACLTEVLFLSDAARRNKSKPDVVEAQIEKISATAREVVRNLDGIVWAVNPENDSLERFAGYVQEFATFFLQPTNVRCRFDFPEKFPEVPLASEVRHHLFLVVKEALNNVVKYAEATEVLIQLQPSEGFFTLALKDNGHGFSRESGSSFGNGLSNMEKRIEKIGGSFRLESAHGKGTRIEIAVPWSRTFP